MQIKKLQYPIKNWSKNWSGRGVAQMDSMESFFSSPSSRPHVVNTTVLTTVKKLTALHKRFPSNNFYLSLITQSKKYALSEKQNNCIEEAYKKHFG